MASMFSSVRCLPIWMELRRRGLPDSWLTEAAGIAAHRIRRLRAKVVPWRDAEAETVAALLRCSRVDLFGREEVLEPGRERKYAPRPGRRPADE